MSPEDATMEAALNADDVLGNCVAPPTGDAATGSIADAAHMKAACLGRSFAFSVHSDMTG